MLVVEITLPHHHAQLVVTGVVPRAVITLLLQPALHVEMVADRLVVITLRPHVPIALHNVLHNVKTRHRKHVQIVLMAVMQDVEMIVIILVQVYVAESVEHPVVVNVKINVGMAVVQNV